MTKETVLLIFDVWLILAVVALLIMGLIAVIATRYNIYLKKTLVAIGFVIVVTGTTMLTCVIIYVNNR